jgi:hypothetical protein
MKRQTMLLMIGTCLALLGRASAVSLTDAVWQTLGHQQQIDINKVHESGCMYPDGLLILASHTAASMITQLMWLAGWLLLLLLLHAGTFIK